MYEGSFEKKKKQTKKREKMILLRALFLEIRPCYSEHMCSLFQKKIKRHQFYFMQKIHLSAGIVYMYVLGNAGQHYLSDDR